VRSPTPAPFPAGACNAPRPESPDALDEALTKIGYDRCSLGLTKDQLAFGMMRTNDARILPDFLPLEENPLRLPAFGAETALWFDDAMNGETPVASAIAAASVRRGFS